MHSRCCATTYWSQKMTVPRGSRERWGCRLRGTVVVQRGMEQAERQGLPEVPTLGASAAAASRRCVCLKTVLSNNTSAVAWQRMYARPRGLITSRYGEDAAWLVLEKSLQRERWTAQYLLIIALWADPVPCRRVVSRYTATAPMPMAQLVPLALLLSLLSLLGTGAWGKTSAGTAAAGGTSRFIVEEFHNARPQNLLQNAYHHVVKARSSAACRVACHNSSGEMGVPASPACALVHRPRRRPACALTCSARYSSATLPVPLLRCAECNSAVYSERTRTCGLHSVPWPIMWPLVHRQGVVTMRKFNPRVGPGTRTSFY